MTRRDGEGFFAAVGGRPLLRFGVLKVGSAGSMTFKPALGRDGRASQGFDVVLPDIKNE